MSAYYARSQPMGSIAGAACRPWASRQMLAGNISAYGRRIGVLGGHTQVLDSMRTAGLLNKSADGIGSLELIEQSHLSHGITQSQLEHFVDFTALTVSENDFEADERIKGLGIPGIGKTIIEHLSSGYAPVVDSRGVVDSQKAESFTVTKDTPFAKDLDDQSIETLNSAVRSILLNEVKNPFTYGKARLNKALNTTIAAVSWAKATGFNAGWNGLKYAGYGTAILLAAAGLAGIGATMLTAPSPLSVGVGLFIAGKGLKFAANHMDPNSELFGHKIVPYLNWAARLLPMLGIIVGGIGIGSSMFDTSFSFGHLLKDLDSLMLGGISYAAGKYGLDVKKALEEQKRSYGGQLDPGTLQRMNKEMLGAVSSVTFDKMYLGIRFSLLAVSALFVGATVGVGTIAGMAALPAAGIIATALMRNSEWFTKEADAFGWLNLAGVRTIAKSIKSLPSVSAMTICANVPQILGHLDKFFDSPPTEFRIHENLDDQPKEIKEATEKFFGAIKKDDDIVRTALIDRIKNTGSITAEELDNLLKAQPEILTKVPLDKVFDSKLFFKRGMSEEAIKKEFDKPDKSGKRFIENDAEKTIASNRLIQIFNGCNQQIKDQWMTYGPMYGLKGGLYVSAFLSGGPLLLAGALAALPIANKVSGIATNFLFDEKSDTAVKAIASSAFMLAPLMGGALFLSSGLGIGLAGLAAYGALMGSIACYASELHGGGHSINSSEGFKKSLTASAKDLMGSLDIMRRIKKVNTLIINPHTGTVEHSLGILFTALFNTTNPNASFVCMSDKQPYDTTVGFDKELFIAHSEKSLLTFVENKRAKIFGMLSRGVFSGNLEGKYSNLAQNLRETAAWLKKDLAQELREKYHTELKGKKRLLRTGIEEYMDGKKLSEEDKTEIMEALFENPGEEVLILRPDWETKYKDDDLIKKINTDTTSYDNYTEDALRVAMQQLMLTADELEQRADRLDKKVRRNMISEADLNEELNIVRCYDKDLVEITTATRKEIAGDERMVRKVENIATINLFRGLAIYKFWRSGPADNYPVADWVSGTWTRVKNPNFMYGAEKGSPEAAKHIWIRRNNVLTEVQKEYKENLSTSNSILAVDNNPREDDRFKRGVGKIKISVNDSEITLAAGDYYYLDTANPIEQTTAPKVSHLFDRKGTPHSFSVNMDGTIEVNDISEDQNRMLGGLKMTGESTTAGTGAPFGTISRNALEADMIAKRFSKKDISIVVGNLDKLFDEEPGMDGVFRYKSTPQKFKDARAELVDISEDAKNYLQTVYESMEISPSVMHLGAYDYSVMMDKNDIEVKTHLLLPAILEREKESNIIVDLIHKFKKPGKYEFSDTGIPANAELTDVDIVDANLELSYGGTIERSKLSPEELDKAKALFKDTSTEILVFKPSTTVADINAIGGISQEVKNILIQHLERIIPYKIDRGALITWRKEGAGKGDPNKQHLAGAEVETDAGGNVTRFSLLYNGGIKRVDLDLSAQPRYLKALFQDRKIPEGTTTTLKMNAFFNDPFREGDMPWLKVSYKEEAGESVCNFSQQEQDAIIGIDGIKYNEETSLLLISPNLTEENLKKIVENPIFAAHKEVVNRLFQQPHNSIKFLRCWDQHRPMLYKKKGLHHPVKTGTNSWDFGYFTVSTEENNLTISNVRLPRGLPVQIIKAWAKGLREGDKVEDVDNSGNIYIIDGKFSPTKPAGRPEKSLKGHIIGIVEGGNKDGSVVDLGDMLLWAAKQAIHVKGIKKKATKLEDISTRQAEQIDNIIEVVPAADGKVEIVSRRRDATGLPLDSSAYIYNLTEEATKRLEAAIPDLRWIDQNNIEITENGVVLHFRVTGSEEDHTFALATNDVVDNFGIGFLKNKDMKVGGTGSIYTGTNENFRPSFDMINGNLRLIVHKVDRVEISAPPGLKGEEGFVIVPTTATSAVKIGEQWIPLNIDSPVVDGKVMEIDKGEEGLSQVYEGQIKSVIGPQTRFGNWGDISLQYPRDPYFYGLPISAGFETINEYGENFGLNRGKALRGQRGIQSGRTHTMPYTLLHNSMFADIMETNSEYYKKLSDYGHWLTGAGVSEDTQMEMVLWLMGLRMHVVKDMLTIMAAEKTFDKYKIQNTTRYNYSESLFAEPFKLILRDLVSGIKPTRDPFYFASPEAMAEITAGRTWYKYPWAKSVELSAIPAFLLTKGYVPFFPVDVPLFMTSWLLRTGADMWNYKQQLNSIGYGLLETGLFENPAKEIGYLNGYNNGAWKQWIQRYQYATFALTSSGGSDVPQEFRNTVNTFFGATVNAEAFAATSILGTAYMENMAGNPTFHAAIHNFFGTGLGMAINMAFATYIIALLQRARTNLIFEGTQAIPQVTLKRAFKITPEELRDAIASKLTTARDAIRDYSGLKEHPKIGKPIKALIGSTSDRAFEATSILEQLAGIVTVSKNNEAIAEFCVTNKSKFNYDKGKGKLTAKGKMSEEDRDTLLSLCSGQPDKEAVQRLFALSQVSILSADGFSLMETDASKMETKVTATLGEGKRTQAVVKFLKGLIEQQHRYTELHEDLQKTKKAITDDAPYSTLFAERDRLFNILKELGCVDNKGRISFGMQNKWKDQANEITEIMALIEMRICINAVNDIRNNHLPTQALAMLKKVMATTQEHLVVDAAAKMYRQVTAGKSRPGIGPKTIPARKAEEKAAA